VKQNAFAFYSKERLFSYASADPAWFNATLALISLHHDIKLGKGVSRECLFRRGEALRIINERLKKSPQQVSDHTIGAIASLASFDVSHSLTNIGYSAYYSTDYKWTLSQCYNAYTRTSKYIIKPRY